MNTVEDAVMPPRPEARSRCYIYSLPVEILVYIMYRALDLNDPQRWNFASAKILACVSKLFFHLFTNSPDLWLTVHLSQGVEVAKVVLRRNQNGLLCVAYDSQTDRTSRAEFEALLELIIETRQRWRRVDIHAEDIERLVSALELTAPTLC